MQLEVIFYYVAYMSNRANGRNKRMFIFMACERRQLCDSRVCWTRLKKLYNDNIKHIQLALYYFGCLSAELKHTDQHSVKFSLVQKKEPSFILIYAQCFISAMSTLQLLQRIARSTSEL